VLPLSYNIAHKRASVVKSPGLAKEAAKDKRKRLVTRPDSSASTPQKQKRVVTKLDSNLSTHDDGEDDVELLKAAEDAVNMGKMFDTMGSKSKAADINEDVLTLFKVEEDFSWEKGFTLSEIHSLGPKSLEIVVTTLIESAKLWWMIFKLDPENNGQAKTRAFKSCMDALDVFDKAPAKNKLKDHSVVFSGYCFMNEIAKAAPYKPPNNQPRDEFEKALSENFVKATNHQQYHHCIALALRADVKRRQGRYEDAIVVIEEIKSIYDPKLHSRAICKEYSVDHCIAQIAVTSNWLYHVGRKEEALKLCEEVIEALPEMIGAGAVGSKFFMLVPICHVLKEQYPTKALNLFRDHVAKPAEEGGSKRFPFIVALSPAIMIILKCLSLSSGGDMYDDLKQDIAFMLTQKYPPILDYISICYFELAMATLHAEACVLLIGLCENAQDKSTLVEKGVQYLEASEQNITNDNGAIVSAVAHSYHINIERQLRILQSSMDEGLTT
jgi:tetratricopeptide (TPR) repeat protein